MRNAFICLAGGTASLLGACSSGTEGNPSTAKAPRLPRLSLESPRRIAAARDTIYPGQLYQRKVFLNNGALRQLAATSNYPYSVVARTFLPDQPGITLDHTWAGDTCYVTIDPSKVPGHPAAITWQCMFHIDYKGNGKATDTVFAIRDVVVVDKQPSR
ncbi:hypothetical protein [Hymenobacter jeollabukensis]|uniref:Lipoprotein n=2 Tax=Hymenobacter jeollabukensis TaxID=2025313 RepID=A0A5R8WWQ8_9BACT|nr:hypothetical protein FDY95_00905 [Hymenobacter jeollabukensis]